MSASSFSPLDFLISEKTEHGDVYKSFPPPTIQEVRLPFIILRNYVGVLCKGPQTSTFSDACNYLIEMSTFENKFYDEKEDKLKLDCRLSELILQACKEDHCDFSNYHHSLLVTEACETLGYPTDNASFRKHWPEYVQRMTS